MISGIYWIVTRSMGDRPLSMCRTCCIGLFLVFWTNQVRLGRNDRRKLTLAKIPLSCRDELSSLRANMPRLYRKA